MGKLQFVENPLTRVFSRPARGILSRQKGQAFTEYILVFALVALLFAGVLGVWKGPLAHYLNRIARAVAATR